MTEDDLGRMSFRELEEHHRALQDGLMYLTPGSPPLPCGAWAEVPIFGNAQGNSTEPEGDEPNRYGFIVWSAAVPLLLLAVVAFHVFGPNRAHTLVSVNIRAPKGHDSYLVLDTGNAAGYCVPAHRYQLRTCVAIENLTNDTIVEAYGAYDVYGQIGRMQIPRQSRDAGIVEIDPESKKCLEVILNLCEYQDRLPIEVARKLYLNDRAIIHIEAEVRHRAKGDSSWISERNVSVNVERNHAKLNARRATP